MEFPKSKANRAPEVAKALAAAGYQVAGKIVYGSEKFGTELRLRRAKKS